MSSIKDCVDEFDIDVDISDCTRLYDYATSREITHEDGQPWSKDQFSSLGGIDYVDVADENLMLQIKKMDKAFADTGCLQTKADDKKDKREESNSLYPTFDFFDTKLNLPPRVLPMYKPGDVVKGSLIVKVNQPIKADKLTLNFMGAGVVNIRIYHKHGYYDDTRYEKYADETRTLWEKSKSNDVSGDFQSLVVKDTPESSKTLPAGTHKFPFEFKIPLETAQSTPNIHPSSHHYGYVVYRIKAEIDSGKIFSSGDLVTHKGLWVSKKYDIGSDLENLQSFTTEETLDTGLIFKSGKISVKAHLPRKAYVKGECIPLSLEIDNQTKGAIDKLTAYINMHGKIRLSNSKLTMSKKINVKGEKKEHENISAGMCPSFNWDLPWNFSRSSVDSNLMPTGTLDDCSLIDVKYDVIVKLKRSGLHRNMELEIPIYVGDFNSRT